MKTLRVRPESFGAWVRLVSPAALVAVDRERARRLGVDGGARWEGPVDEARSTAPLEVHLALNARCGVGCTGCYLEATPRGEAPALEALKGRLTALAEAGVFTVAFGGGEPLLRRDLGELAAHARSLGMTPVMTTSGAGLTAERARELQDFGQINVSHDGVAGGYEAVRGVDGAAMAERAVGLLVAEGLRVGLNLVMTRQSFATVEATAARGHELGACEVQLLRYKPSGRAGDATYLARRLSATQVASLPALLGRLVARSGLSVRVDCSMLPWLATGEFSSDALERLGVLGCEAGRHLAAATVEGRVAPCSFVGASTLDVTELAARWEHDDELAAWRARPVPSPCAECAWQRVCRGGCRAVAAWYGDPVGPDPECPRVQAWREASCPGG